MPSRDTYGLFMQAIQQIPFKQANNYYFYIYKYLKMFLGNYQFEILLR